MRHPDTLAFVRDALAWGVDCVPWDTLDAPIAHGSDSTLARDPDVGAIVPGLCAFIRLGRGRFRLRTMASGDATFFVSGLGGDYESSKSEYAGLFVQLVHDRTNGAHMQSIASGFAALRSEIGTSRMSAVRP